MTAAPAVADRALPAAPRLLSAPRTTPTGSLAGHLAVHGRRPAVPDRRSAARLVAEVERAGIRGRGGGGYPLAAKLAAVAARRGRKVVVVNAAESEPASAKDAVLLARAPHLVLDGVVLAAEAVGAAEAVLWRHGTDPVLSSRIAERAGLDRVPVRLAAGPRSYVAGESSAVVRALSGGPARPAGGGPAARSGVDGRPTLLANAETLAQLALVARHGADWYRGVGTAEDPGTLPVTGTAAP